MIQRLAVVAERLALPHDEGMKKTAAAFVTALRPNVDALLVASYGAPAFEDTRVAELPTNPLLASIDFARTLRRFAPQAVLYIPYSAAIPSSFARARLLKLQAGGAPTALLSLQPRPWGALACRLGLGRLADLALAQSHEGVGLLARGGSAARWLPGGVDLERYRPAMPEARDRLRARFGLRAYDRVVLHVGHIKPERNLSPLKCLAAMGFRVVVAGSTTTQAHSALRADLERAGILVLTEYLADIESLYQVCDCYVFPTLATRAAIEVPLSVLEAMACNVPVVTTPFGGLPDMFSPGQGLIFARGEQEMLDGVRLALTERGCRTRELVSPYDWRTVARRLLVLLEEML
jgi:glycosyltransferase involved in cell wall biosynthesis